ncbi:hypothetical protein C482_09627 [Natrialba chahannaoensis JCM 10990]|uniref:Uncharacterized protein n=1 Tax=Natrialba chahannaoensis JCM 10990 TaxID=1227492 RepID=M0ALY8_9EURY|nr:hypothetical protein [Natrialba chahannaoensis]ELY99735.1 hypothetical protein C482_09627 [Natrialba chahannaoensis JCM 10990]
MLEFLLFIIVLVVGGVLLFLPTLAMSWWQSERQNDSRSTDGNEDTDEGNDKNGE